MQYRKLQADKIFNGFRWLDKDDILIAEEDGSVVEIVTKENAGEHIEQFDGILVPGLINCHCHLELSHLKNAVTPGTGLIAFLECIIKNRSASAPTILGNMVAAEKEMHKNGTVAVADICNTTDSIEIKTKSLLHWHNLIEVVNLHDANLDKRLKHFSVIIDQFKTCLKNSSKCVLTPHAPYSVSAGTLKIINELTQKAIISIHNQECTAENDLFKTGGGGFLNFFKVLGEDLSPFKLTGKTSLQTWLPYFTNEQTILLVHNTYMSEEDIIFAKAHAEKYGLNLVYCLCPNANIYIENTLPPIDLFLKHNCKMVIGTDSYSSNEQLNIAEEIKTLSENFSQIPLETMLQWATHNGAEALQISLLGSFEKGKVPGVVLLKTHDSNNEKITGQSQRII